MSGRSNSGTKSRKKTLAGKLAGKTVALVGKFGYGNTQLDSLVRHVESAGGKIVNAENSDPDYLVAGEGRGGNPPPQVAKVQKRSPAVTVLDAVSLCQMLAPSRDELCDELRVGKLTEARWEELAGLFGYVGPLDLSGMDLRKLDLFGAKLDDADLDAADLRDVSAHYADLPNLCGARFDNADLSEAYIRNCEDISFRKANMVKAWLGYGIADTYRNCDFRQAKMQSFRAQRCKFIHCDFSDADLADAEVLEADFTGANLAGANLALLHGSKTNFENANLSRAHLSRADLRGASLVNADLSGADLREAVLSGADLTGAQIAGANFERTVLTDAKLAGLDCSKAKNFKPPIDRKPGSKLVELAQAAAGSNNFETIAEVDLQRGEHAKLTLYLRGGGQHLYIHAHSAYVRDGNQIDDFINAPTVEQGMLNLADRWPGATLRLDSIKAKGSRSMRGKKLVEVAMAAWAEAFGLDATAMENLHQHKAKQQAEIAQLRETMLSELHGGAAGVKKWNARTDRERQQINPLRDLDFSKAKLSGANLSNCDLHGGRFEAANLKKAGLFSAKLKNANFDGADLSGADCRHVHAEGASFKDAKLAGCEFSSTRVQGANFGGADLADADLSYSRLEGADFTGANLHGVKFDGSNFDAATKFPSGFKRPANMHLVGAQAATLEPEAPPAAVGTISFESFYEQLTAKVDSARLDKAANMLKAERFQLFAEVKDDVLLGVVKSQSSDDLVYSCRLTSEGKFGCCTQNLNPCGGLRGALCKHLLVLIVGLAKAGQLDPATVDNWVNASRRQKPAIDKDAMSETFLRYKGAEAGEVDWRPTETIPEDYYAL